jgi:hypothetical protein
MATRKAQVSKVTVSVDASKAIAQIKQYRAGLDSPGGMKFDGGKSRFSLLRFGCARAMAGVAKVLTFGAAKYAAHSWREVDEGIDRYWSAMERHMNEIAINGLEARDEESGLLHIDHVNCNGLFLSELIRKQHGID